MDTKKVKPTEQQTNTETIKWKLPEYRKKTMNKCMEVIIKRSGWKDKRVLSDLNQHLERLEARVNAAAKSEAEYLRWLSGKVKGITSKLKTGESRPRPSNFTDSGEISAQEAGKSANIEWKEQAYQKAQRINRAYFPKLYAFYQHVNRKLKQLESSPQEPNRVILEELRKKMEVSGKIISLLRVSKNKNQITIKIKENLHKAEYYLENIFFKNISSHLQGQQHSADVKSSQQSGPSHSSISQMEILEMKPSPQALGTQNYLTTKDVSQQNTMCLQEQKPSPEALGRQNYHTMKDVSQQNKMCLQQQKVERQYSNSQQDVNPLSIIKGPGNVVQQQAQGAQKATEAFSVGVNTQGNSASPLIENCNNLKDISRKPILTFDEPSSAMEHFLEVLTSISLEGLSASVGEIREVVYLDDVIPTSELINVPQMLVQQQKPPRLIPQTGTNLASDINSCSQDSFNQLTDAEEPDLIAVISKIKHPRIVENCSLLEEIKEINNLLIDSEVVISEKDIIQSEAGGVAEHGEGLVIEFLFNAVTVNQDLISHLSADKKSIIKPLFLLVPTNYPFSPPIILDQTLPEVSSEDPKDLSTIAKSKLRFSLQFLNQPWSLGAIAKSWERCAREAILEYAQGIGGGTFSSKYEGWEMCQNFV